MTEKTPKGKKHPVPTFSQNKINQFISRGRRALKVPTNKRTPQQKKDIINFRSLGAPAEKEFKKSKQKQ